nr:DUF2837 family protein [Paenibacillus terrae]
MGASFNGAQSLEACRLLHETPNLVHAHLTVQGSDPKRLITLNITVTAIYTTGVVSALYASFQSPAQGTAMSMSSGLINGMATILLTLLIDPRLAVLSGKMLRGELPLNRMNSMYGWMIISRLGGTLLAQLLLVPLAIWLGWIMG